MRCTLLSPFFNNNETAKEISPSTADYNERILEKEAEIHKTALGAEDVVEWQYFADTMQAVDALRSEGYGIYSIEQVEDSIPLQQFGVEDGARYAVIFGNEVKGVQRLRSSIVH